MNKTTVSLIGFIPAIIMVVSNVIKVLVVGKFGVGDIITAWGCCSIITVAYFILIIRLHNNEIKDEENDDET